MSSFGTVALFGRFRVLVFAGVGTLADEGRMLFCKEKIINIKIGDALITFYQLHLTEAIFSYTINVTYLDSRD